MSQLKQLIALFSSVVISGLCTTSVTAQQQFTETINVDGQSRSYVIYLPVNFDASENMPLMFFFHGGGGTANEGIFECDFRSLANSERFIAVYPQAIDSTSGTNSWDCLGDYHGGIDEMGFVSAMIDALADSLPGSGRGTSSTMPRRADCVKSALPWICARHGPSQRTPLTSQLSAPVAHW